MSKQFQSLEYDAIYSAGGDANIYGIHYRHSGYYPLFKQVFRMLRGQMIRSVLEVGCGTGGFAHLLREKSPETRYRGFDFSPVAIERAIERTGQSNQFFVADARSPSSYLSDFDTIVCTEVLEHIEEDLDVVAQWPNGGFCVCSVPNFDADNHVRYFSSKEDVLQRYGSLIDIEHVVNVKKPFLSDISLASRIRNLRWNRYRPRRLLAILGLAPFEVMGGWYVFSGRRNGVTTRASEHAMV